METPQLKFLDNFVGMPTFVLRQLPIVRAVQKPVEIPQLQIVVKVVDLPIVVQR